MEASHKERNKRLHGDFLDADGEYEVVSMEALVQERIKRLHGDFLDADGEYELVSSLSTNKYQQAREAVPDKVVQDVRTAGYQQQQLAEGFAYTFYFIVIWSIVLLAFIAWISIRWMDLSSPWNNNRKEMKSSDPDESSTSSKDGCTRATAKAFSHGNNLSSQFEKVVDRVESKEVIISSASASQTSKTDVTLFGSIETTKITATTQKKHIHVTTVGKVTEQNGDKVEEKGAGVSTSKKKHETDTSTCQETRQINDRPLDHIQRCQSPPPLEDEPVGDLPARTLLTEAGSPAKPAIPSPSESLQSSTSCCSGCSDPPTGDMAHASHPSPSPPYTPLKFDSSLAPVMPYVSSSQQTPQTMAQEFVQNVEIIEKVLLRSSSNVDPSCAVDLAMMHQSSHFKMQEQRQHMAHEERQQSSIRHDKYDEYLKELSKARDQCMEACSSSINYSMLLCLLLEASRQARKLMDSLDYFSMKEASAILLHMACGCEDDGGFARDDSNPHASYISMLSTYFLSTLESSVIKFADYASCIMAYGVVLVCWQAAHGMLRTLHCPAFFHQLLNGMVLVMYLAQNPGAWIVVTRNLELYYVWFKLQGTLTTASFAMTVIWYVKIRSYILERQQQIIQTNPKGNREGVNHLTQCDARRRIAHMEDLSWIIIVVPSMILGLVVVLTTTEKI